ncbi:hypothetical protein SCAR479_04001 [Seiridium cardinale]|uniref:Uncharacterized protein n=1 Tax=Seiridium cardinale TaxID=138064 RepID=A0ABR2XZA5_9PEZI
MATSSQGSSIRKTNSSTPSYQFWQYNTEPVEMQAVTRLLTLAALLASCVSAAPTSARGNLTLLPPTNLTSAAGAANETEPPFIGTDEASPLPDGAVGEDTTVSTFGLGDKNADLLAEFEFKDLLKRFELLECWDAGYQHFDGSEEWDCGDWHFSNWYNLYWDDGRVTGGRTGPELLLGNMEWSRFWLEELDPQIHMSAEEVA